MTEKELLERGFIFQSKVDLDDGDYYKWWKLKIRDIDLMFTVEYTNKGDEITSRNKKHLRPRACVSRLERIAGVSQPQPSCNGNSHGRNLHPCTESSVGKDSGEL